MKIILILLLLLSSSSALGKGTFNSRGDLSTRVTGSYDFLAYLSNTPSADERVNFVLEKEYSLLALMRKNQIFFGISAERAKNSLSLALSPKKNCTLNSNLAFYTQDPWVDAAFALGYRPSSKFNFSFRYRLLKDTLADNFFLDYWSVVPQAIYQEDAGVKLNFSPHPRHLFTLELERNQMIDYHFSRSSYYGPVIRIKLGESSQKAWQVRWLYNPRPFLYLHASIHPEGTMDLDFESRPIFLRNKQGHFSLSLSSSPQIEAFCVERFGFSFQPKPRLYFSYEKNQSANAHTLTIILQGRPNLSLINHYGQAGFSSKLECKYKATANFILNGSLGYHLPENGDLQTLKLSAGGTYLF